MLPTAPEGAHRGDRTTAEEGGSRSSPAGPSAGAAASIVNQARAGAEATATARAAAGGTCSRKKEGDKGQGSGHLPPYCCFPHQSSGNDELKMTLQSLDSIPGKL